MKNKKQKPEAAQSRQNKDSRQSAQPRRNAAACGEPRNTRDSSKSSGGFSHPDYDAAVLECFLEKQLQLFPEKVASTPEEAADFLEMCFAVVVKNRRQVREYFEETGIDVEGEDLLSAAEVFPVGDGRYLIVEG